jgi:type I site-specific restriction endonuclease
VITNIQQLASRADRWLPAFSNDFFDLILVDEGHHKVARGERVYAYPFRTAMVRGYYQANQGHEHRVRV